MNLSFIQLIHSCSITDFDIDDVLQNLSKLQKLVIIKNSKVTSSGFYKLTKIRSIICLECIQL